MIMITIIVQLIEQGQVEIPTRLLIKGSRPFYWILLKEANLYKYLIWVMFLFFALVFTLFYVPTAYHNLTDGNTP